MTVGFGHAEAISDFGAEKNKRCRVERTLGALMSLGRQEGMALSIQMETVGFT